MQTKNDLYLQSQSNKESVYISKGLEDIIDIDQSRKAPDLIIANVITQSIVKNVEVIKLKNRQKQVTIKMICDSALVEDFVKNQVNKIKIFNIEYNLKDNYCYSFKKNLDSYNVKLKILGE